MKIETLIAYCEELADDYENLMNKNDDASGYTRSHNKEIRTDYAIKCEQIIETFRELAEKLRNLQAYEEAFSEIKRLPIAWEEGAGIQKCIDLIEKRLEKLDERKAKSKEAEKRA